MRRTTAFGGWLLAAAVCAPAHAEQGVANTRGRVPRLRVETYDVEGTTAQEIRRDLNRRGPLSHGQRFDARTEWNVRWRFDLEPRDESCRATRPRVDLDVLVTLPRWRQPTDAPASLVERWQRYLRALENHEEGHAAIGASAADEIRAALAQLPPAPTCDEAERRANRAGQEIVGAHNRRDEEYDEQTDHGATQGARFP
jgi:predicted secreted Zn-dependent protease